jgi:hypothetical protein
MRPELAAFVDWLRESGRMAEVNYPRLVHQVVDLLGHAGFIAHNRYDLHKLACATEGVPAHPEAAVRDHQDAVALASLLEDLLALARFVATTPYGSSWPPVCSPTRRSTTGSTRPHFLRGAHRSCLLARCQAGL